MAHGGPVGLCLKMCPDRDLLAAGRRANYFGPLLFIDMKCTFCFQLLSVDCPPNGRTQSIAVSFFGGFRVLYLYEYVLRFLYYAEKFSIFLIAGAQRRVPHTPT